MELAFVIYLIDVVTQFRIPFGIGPWAFVAGIALFFFLVITACVADAGYLKWKDVIKEYNELLHLKKILIMTFLLAVFSSLFNSLIPSKETAYTMLAAYGVQTVAESPRVQGLMGSGLSILEKKLKAYEEEFTPVVLTEETEEKK